MASQITIQASQVVQVFPEITYGEIMGIEELFAQ
jgi:hypothetical protein